MNWQGQCLTIILGTVTKVTVADKKGKKRKTIQAVGGDKKQRKNIYVTA
jgi:hypothetical protein